MNNSRMVDNNPSHKTSTIIKLGRMYNRQDHLIIIDMDCFRNITDGIQILGTF